MGEYTLKKMTKEEIADSRNDLVKRVEIYQRGLYNLLNINTGRLSQRQALEMFSEACFEGNNLDTILDLDEVDIENMKELSRDRCMFISQNLMGSYGRGYFFATSLDEDSGKVEGYYVDAGFKRAYYSKDEFELATIMCDRWWCKEQFTKAKGYDEPPTFKELAENGTLAKYMSEEADKLFGGEITLIKKERTQEVEYIYPSYETEEEFDDDEEMEL